MFFLPRGCLDQGVEEGLRPWAGTRLWRKKGWGRVVSVWAPWAQGLDCCVNTIAESEPRMDLLDTNAVRKTVGTWPPHLEALYWF